MTRVEQYKIFHNSQDFEKIYKQSISEITKYFSDVNIFYQKHIKIAIQNNRLFLYYHNENVIGYMLYSVKNKIAFWDFDFISKENRNRKYGRSLRIQMFEHIKNEANEFTFWIHNKNKSSRNSVKKIAQLLNYKIIEEPENVFRKTNGVHFKVFL